MYPAPSILRPGVASAPVAGKRNPFVPSRNRHWSSGVKVTRRLATSRKKTLLSHYRLQTWRRRLEFPNAISGWRDLTTPPACCRPPYPLLPSGCQFTLNKAGPVCGAGGQYVVVEIIGGIVQRRTIQSIANPDIGAGSCLQHIGKIFRAHAWIH